MQMETAKQIRHEWGDKLCDHPHFEKEYYLGSQTGDYVCTQCGESFSPEAVEQIRAGKTEKKKI